jgi:hypothetical protein
MKMRGVRGEGAPRCILEKGEKGWFICPTGTKPRPARAHNAPFD